MDEPECAWCERGIALVSLLIGVGVVFIAVDVLAGGRLTRSLTRGRALAQVIEFPGADDAAS